MTEVLLELLLMLAGLLLPLLPLLVLILPLLGFFVLSSVTPAFGEPAMPFATPAPALPSVAP
jgi:hypothetical protein